MIMRKLDFKRKDLFSTLKLDQKHNNNSNNNSNNNNIVMRVFPTSTQKGPNKLNHAEVVLKYKIESFQVINLFTTFQQI